MLYKEQCVCPASVLDFHRYFSDSTALIESMSMRKSTYFRYFLHFLHIGERAAGGLFYLVVLSRTWAGCDPAKPARLYVELRNLAGITLVSERENSRR